MIDPERIRPELVEAASRAYLPPGMSEEANKYNLRDALARSLNALIKNEEAWKRATIATLGAPREVGVPEALKLALVAAVTEPEGEAG